MTLAWYDPTNHHVSTNKNDPLFTPLGQLWPLDREREWVGLMAREIPNIEGYKVTPEMYWFARAIEAKLKEKNS
jgi:hypothetical protein